MKKYTFIINEESKTKYIASFVIRDYEGAIVYRTSRFAKNRIDAKRFLDSIYSKLDIDCEDAVYENYSSPTSREVFLIAFAHYNLIKIEPKIDEPFTLNDCLNLFQCIEIQGEKHCAECAFFNAKQKCVYLKCRANERSDEKEVIFKEIPYDRD